MKADLARTIEGALHDKRLHHVGGLYIVTDELDYTAVDQVFPMFAEQQLFLDELVHHKIEGAHVLDIGVGSGVLAIGAARAGAKRVTALEINPRAKTFAGFNVILNRVEDKISILDGHEQVYRPVLGQRFDYIVSNPPYEPTPPDMANFYHSAGGPTGTDFLEKILAGLDEHLTADGHAQVVTGAPGDARGPSRLFELIERHLSGQTTVLVNPYVHTFDEVMDLVAGKGMGSVEAVDALRRRAKAEGITHLHLCLIHYEKGPKQLRMEPTKKEYIQYWNLPLPAVSP